MTKPMGRRAFLKAAVAAPMVAEKLAQEAVGAEVLPTAAAETAALAGVPPSSGIYGSAGKMQALSQLQKAGLMPDWAKRQIVRAQARQCRFIEPDVACLQSVTLGSKIRISGEHRYTRAIETMEGEAMDTQMMAEFFGWG